MNLQPIRSCLAIAEFSAKGFIRFHNLIPLQGLNQLFTEARSLLRRIHERSEQCLSKISRKFETERAEEAAEKQAGQKGNC
jgi:hypothetical protein